MGSICDDEVEKYLCRFSLVLVVVGDGGEMRETMMELVREKMRLVARLLGERDKS